MICCQDILDGEFVNKEYHCTHIFHEECLSQWLQISSLGAFDYHHIPSAEGQTPWRRPDDFDHAPKSMPSGYGSPFIWAFSPRSHQESNSLFLNIWSVARISWMGSLSTKSTNVLTSSTRRVPQPVATNLIFRSVWSSSHSICGRPDPSGWFWPCSKINAFWLRFTPYTEIIPLYIPFIQFDKSTPWKYTLKVQDERYESVYWVTSILILFNPWDTGWSRVICWYAPFRDQLCNAAHNKLKAPLLRASSMLRKIVKL